ncbi:MAG: MBL fold metallo-hydrolase [Chloroflexota bacterium]
MIPDTAGALRLDIVGAGPAFTDRPGATGAAYLVRHGSTAILLDLGQGSFPRLAGLLDPGTLDAVLISHLHPDHFIDLVALRHFLCWGPRAPRRVRVIGPKGLGDRIDALHAEPGFSAAALDVDALEPGLIRIGSITVEVAPVTHDGASFAFRLSPPTGRGLVYTGDCGRTEDLDPLIRPGDFLLSEVSFGPGPVPANAAHLDGPAVGSLASRTRAGRVLLTHLLMGFDENETVASARAAYGGPVALVQPGETYLLD